MGTYVPDKFVKGVMNSTGCSVEEAFARVNGDPANKNNTGLPNGIYDKELDAQFKKNHDYYKRRNARFYKLLGQNYAVLSQAILRGKDIYYKIPKRYEMNTNHPFLLDWLLAFGRPCEITMVRNIGPVKLACLYNALQAWIDLNPLEANGWVYQKEWEDYFNDAKTQIVTAKNDKKLVDKEDSEFISCEKEKTQMNTIKDILPELKFHTKQVGNPSDQSGDVRITICGKKEKTHKSKEIRICIYFRHGVYKKFETGYLVFAQLGNRLYFKQTGITNGFKLMSRKGSDQSYRLMQANISAEEEKELQKFTNKELELKFDKAYELYYVEV